MEIRNACLKPKAEFEHFSEGVEGAKKSINIFFREKVGRKINICLNFEGGRKQKCKTLLGRLYVI